MPVVRQPTAGEAAGHNRDRDLPSVSEASRAGLITTGTGAARNVGTTLVLLRIAMLVIGIVYPVQFMLGLRKERDAMKVEGLIYGESAFPRR